jgi:ATP-dependent Clp protease adapter protein ClpS
MKLENLVIDKKPDTKAATTSAPEETPGGATVMILNDPITPAEVVVEAIMHGTGLSKQAAMKRMMRAHRNGWVPIASYATKDIAETIANKIEQHARNNPNYDHYRPFVRHNGPWPLAVEVMDAEQ